MHTNFRVDPEAILVEEQRLIAAATARIHDAMEARQLTQADVAERIGCAPSYVSMVLNGTRNVTLRTLATFGLACEERWVFSAVAQVGAGVSTLASMDLGRPQGQDPQVGSQPG